MNWNKPFNKGGKKVFFMSSMACWISQQIAVPCVTNRRRWLRSPRQWAVLLPYAGVTARLKRDGTRAETRVRLSPKRTSPFKSAGASVQSTAGSRGVRISGSNAGYTMFRGIVRVLATHSIRQFPLHFPSRASPCAIGFQTHYTK